VCLNEIARIAKIAKIAKIGDLKTYKFKDRGHPMGGFFIFCQTRRSPGRLQSKPPWREEREPEDCE
jgi:hypothetical protein